MKLEGSWFDSSSVWTEDEILNLVASITRNSTHPLCRELSRNFSQTTLPISFADIQSLPHLGLQLHMRTRDGQSLDVRLGSYTWFKSEAHDFSPDGERTLQDWVDRGLVSSFLSINHRIVAGFAFSQEARPSVTEFFEVLKNSYRKVAIWSSAQSCALQTYPRPVEESVSDLLPLERETQLRRWKERSPKFLELRATWDPPSELPGIVFCGENEDVAARNDILVFHRDLKSASWLFSEGVNWRKALKRAVLLPVIAAGLSALSPSPVWTLLAVVVCYAICLLALIASKSSGSGQ